MSSINRVGVDLAKNIFHIHAVDERDKIVWQGKYKRDTWIKAIAKRVPPSAVIAFEACASAHFWARELTALGYQVKLIAPQYVKPYVKTNKNDKVDAEAICEASGRPQMRFVRVKTVEQQDDQALHRVREDLVRQRTAKVNQIRGLVGEYGIVASWGIGNLRQAIPFWLEDGENALTCEFRHLLALLYEDLSCLDERIETLTNMIKQRISSKPESKRLLAVTGIGPLVCSALLLEIDGKQFKNGRDFAASLGLTPRQHSTGGKDTLLGISKRGDGYIRKILVHGARSAYRHSKKKSDSLSLWIQRLSEKKHANVVIVALANKLARIAWALVAKNETYDEKLASA
ncbi:IS110 family transposase [Photobacterium lutimaris]|uniref:IS110 family transposase n=1 Tax=Photobacterium lutimaris TaxID=388278 RepID=A0A2T3J2H0_9GAMM|nr:IS110 family transposase [Photobacterium lutimaris]PSU35494.1 IS110 family transposase [Photobacterium lutimaris]TDR78541.1 transposase [Photobacterium lutimaris]